MHFGWQVDVSIVPFISMYMCAYSLNMANLFLNTIKYLKAVSLLASPHGTTVYGLMEGLGISRRSVFRLLQTFGELGFPIIDNQPMPKTEKTYRLLDSYIIKLPNITVPDPGLNAGEIIFIMALLETCKRHNLFRDAPILNSAKEKLTAILSGMKNEKKPLSGLDRFWVAKK